MTSRVLELTPTTWETMQRHLDHAEENHQKARSIKDEVHELSNRDAEDHASALPPRSSSAPCRGWSSGITTTGALRPCASPSTNWRPKGSLTLPTPRTIHQQIAHAHAEANAIEGDDVRRAILIEKAELVKREGRNRVDMEVRRSAEAEATLDREGQRLEELEREVEAAIADEQAQAQQQEAEVEAEVETTTH